MMKKRIGLLAAVTAAVFILTACGGSRISFEKKQSLASTGDSWTVLLYLCGGTVDEEKVYDVMDQLSEVEYSENIKFVLQTGGKTAWSRDGMYSDYLQRFVMQSGSACLVDQVQSEDMCSSNALSDFLIWGTKEYKADHYMLGLWGESSGVLNGMGIDEQFGYSSLSVEDIYYSLSLTNTNFDIVGFDASYMSSLEMAAALAPYADYMVGSEETISEGGWDYKALAEYLIANPKSEPGDVCRNICGDYYNKCVKNNEADNITMAAVDLSRVTELAQAFDGMAGMMAFASGSIDYTSGLLRKLDYVEKCGALSSNENYTDMADLSNLTETISADMGSTASVVTETLDKAIIYNVAGKNRPYMKGLGVYFPVSETAESIDRYCKVFTSHNYLTFVRNVCIDSPTVLGMGETDFTTTAAYADYMSLLPGFSFNAAQDGGTLNLTINGDTRIVKNVGVNAYTYDKDTNKPVRVISDYNVSGDIGGNVFSKTLGDISLMTLNGHTVSAELVERGYTQDIYSVPVILNGERASVRVVHIKDTDSYEILGVWSGVDPASNMDKRDMRRIRAWDEITPIMYTYGNGEEIYGKRFTVMPILGCRAGTKKIELPAAYEYEVTDIYGHTYGSQLFEITE